MLEELQLRIYGDAALPTLIYFPGLHGDWTLVGGFRKHLLGHVRFVEFTYPRTLTWTLEDYAANIEIALAKNGITHGWLLGESFGSQIVWPLVRRGKFQAQGIILAGGFVKHPMRWGARLSEKLCGQIPFSILVQIMLAFTKFARACYCRSLETSIAIDEFAVRRTELDRQAMQHRLHLIAESDPRTVASATKLPVFYLSGGFDPIVPWPCVKYWLQQHCPTLRASQIIFIADHNILGTASAQAARQVLAWINQPPVLRIAA